MRENYRKSIASIEKLPQFTTMNVIDGQAGIIICSRLIFYSLTIDNILNIIIYTIEIFLWFLKNFNNPHDGDIELITHTANADIVANWQHIRIIFNIILSLLQIKFMNISYQILCKMSNMCNT